MSKSNSYFKVKAKIIKLSSHLSAEKWNRAMLIDCHQGIWKNQLVIILQLSFASLEPLGAISV